MTRLETLTLEAVAEAAVILPAAAWTSRPESTQDFWADY